MKAQPRLALATVEKTMQKRIRFRHTHGLCSAVPLLAQCVGPPCDLRLALCLGMPPHVPPAPSVHDI